MSVDGNPDRNTQIESSFLEHVYYRGIRVPHCMFYYKPLLKDDEAALLATMNRDEQQKWAIDHELELLKRSGSIEGLFVDPRKDQLWVAERCEHEPKDEDDYYDYGEYLGHCKNVGGQEVKPMGGVHIYFLCDVTNVHWEQQWVYKEPTTDEECAEEDYWADELPFTLMSVYLPHVLLEPQTPNENFWTHPVSITKVYYRSEDLDVCYQMDYGSKKDIHSPRQDYLLEMDASDIESEGKDHQGKSPFQIVVVNVDADGNETALMPDGTMRRYDSPVPADSSSDDVLPF